MLPMKEFALRLNKTTPQHCFHSFEIPESTKTLFD